jgi:hypothetical protein
MLIPLVVALWQGVNFGGVKRTLIEDVGNLSNWNFDKRTQAIGVHPGPSFNSWTSFTPTVTFLSEDSNAGSLTLGPGAYPDLSQFNWDGRISSVRFNLNQPVPIGSVDFKTGRHTTVSALPVAAIASIPLVLDAWTDFSPYPEPEGYPPGKRIQLVESSASLHGEFGNEFNDSIKTIRVRRGPDYGGFDVVRLCRDDYYLAGYVEYGPSNQIITSDWGAYGPYTSSVYFTEPPKMPTVPFQSSALSGPSWLALLAQRLGG